MRSARDEDEWTQSRRDEVFLPPVEGACNPNPGGREVLSRIREFDEYRFELERFYRALAPNGRELSAPERAEARERLVARELSSAGMA